MLDRARALQDQLSVWRRTIHRQPELGFEEHQTAGLVARTLHEMGLVVETEVGKTGVVAHLGEGNGPVVALRADMDALPITEINDVDYASEHPGIMHACGHDGHTAILMGAAALLAEEYRAGRLPGRVRFLFQPSEEGQDDEGKSGGLRFVEEGVMDGVSAVFGLHVEPKLPVGTVGLRSGPMMAAADSFKIEVLGQSCHAARPHEGIDAIVLAAQVVTALQQVVARRVSPIKEAVLTIGTIQGGTKSNIVADRVTMEGTIRSFDPDVRESLIAGLQQACAIPHVLGGDARFHFYPGYPVLENDEQTTAFCEQVAHKLLGAENVRQADLMMGAEDFSFLAQRAPACFIRLGVKAPEWPEPRPIHTPMFDLDERALPVGAAMLAQAALDWLQKKV